MNEILWYTLTEFLQLQNYSKEDDYGYRHSGSKSRCNHVAR
jgi:hypothetical protein